MKQGVEEKRLQRKRVRSFLTLALFVVLVILLVALWHLIVNKMSATIYIEPNDAEMTEGEELPQTLTSRILVSGNPSTIIEDRSELTVDGLVEEFCNGEGFTLYTDADPDEEGTYTLSVRLNEDVKKQLNSRIIRMVKVELGSATLTVENAVGDWDGEKFKTYDGDYVTSDFVRSKGKEYYFDEDGNKVTGLTQIDGSYYYFEADGAMVAGQTVTIGGKKYTFTSDGKALTGWQEIDGDTYYYTHEGSMVTGEYYLGFTKCDFDEDGKLLSKETVDVDPDRPMLALTFDDGPGERTLELLDALESNDAHATFFMVGQNISAHEDALKKMKEIGCELGNHSWDHTELTTLSADGIRNEVEKTNDAIKAAVGESATLLRPPYGSMNSTVHETVGMPMIIWSIDTLDWETRNVQSTIDTVMEDARDGDIILIHDIHTESVDAAIELIPMLEEEGYQLVTVSEMANARGITLKDGESYENFYPQSD